MLKNSIIGKTNQNWKLVVAALALLIGSAMPAFPAAGLSWTGGTILAVGGYAFGVLLIRCPACGVRWFWDALTRAELYKALLTESDCPGCGREFNTADRRD